MTNSINLIEENNLSVAWAKALLNAMNCTAGEISPLVVNVVGFNNGVILEEERIREKLFKDLFKKGKTQIETVAGTIFPKAYWNQKCERKLLYNRYLKCWPRIAKCKTNNRGSYFKRFIDFFENGEREGNNQLEQIITTWHKGNRRRSALQAAVFDPSKDHKHSRRLGFPCLQQVAFNPIGTNGKDGLAVIGFYATQHLFAKAYGNYLGLCRLGQFVAHEMNLELKKMICIASSAKLGDNEITKNSLKNLEQELRKILNKIELEYHNKS